MKCNLVQEVLDMQLLDIAGKKAGRVDGIVVELPDDGTPPKVIAIEVSPITLLARFSPRLARWYAKIDARFGKDRGRPYRIPWERVIGRGPSVTFTDEIETTPINALEDWLREKIVDRIPGSS
jgi:hypothetical protein